MPHPDQCDISSSMISALVTVRKQHQIKKQFEHELTIASNAAWKAVQISIDDFGEYAIYPHALSFFPDFVGIAAEKCGLTFDICTSTEMRRTILNAEKDGRAQRELIPLLKTLGTFDGKNLEIHVLDAKLPETIFSIPLGWQTKLDITGHEIAHFVDWCCYIFSRNSSSFEECFNKESHLFAKEIGGTLSEFFANSAWISLRYPDITEKYMPHTKRWFSNFWNKSERLFENIS